MTSLIDVRLCDNTLWIFHTTSQGLKLNFGPSSRAVARQKGFRARATVNKIKFDFQYNVRGSNA